MNATRTHTVSFNFGPLLVLLFVVFVTLKLAGIGQVATWSWWWVTAPLWVPYAIVGALLIVGSCVVVGLAAMFAFIEWLGSE